MWPPWRSFWPYSLTWHRNSSLLVAKHMIWGKASKLVDWSEASSNLAAFCLEYKLQAINGVGSGRHLHHRARHGSRIFAAPGACFWRLVPPGSAAWSHLTSANPWMSWGEAIRCSISNCSYILLIADSSISLVIHVNHFENIYMCVCASAREEMYSIIGACTRRTKFHSIFWVRKGSINRNCNTLNNLKTHWRTFWICHVLQVFPKWSSQ